MSDQQECPGTVNGVCGLHGVTEERRASDRSNHKDLAIRFEKHLESTERYRENNTLLIAGILSFKNRALGFSVLGILLITSCFTYTNMLSTKIDGLVDQVSNNRTDMAVLASRVDTTNSRLSELISVLREKK